MRRDEALRILRGHMAELRAMGVRSLSLFGSVPREQATDASDVDILVELDGPATFDGFMDVKLRLEDWLGVRVDLVTRKALRSRLRERIEAEAIEAVRRAAKRPSMFQTKCARGMGTYNGEKSPACAMCSPTSTSRSTTTSCGTSSAKSCRHWAQSSSESSMTNASAADEPV